MSVTFGAAMPELDRIYRLVSEITLKRKDILNPHWAPPLVDQAVHFMPDWLDRMDWSAWSFDQVLAHYTQQDQLPAALGQMRTGLARAEEALALAENCALKITANRRLFDVVPLAALNHKVKCSLGPAFTTAARLLKFPRPDDAPDRRAAARGTGSGRIGEVVNEELWSDRTRFYHDRRLPRDVVFRPDFVGWSGLGPISILLENVIGVDVDAAAGIVEWTIRRTDEHGVNGLPVGKGATVDLLCEERPAASSPASAHACSQRDILLRVRRGTGCTERRLAAGEACRLLV